jgi:NTE family protein
MGEEKPRRRVGLALGSGAARGLAHIGVIRAVCEAGIRVDLIAGTSIGAFIGAAFACGTLERLAQGFLSFDWKRIIALLDPVLPRYGLIDGQKVAAFVSGYCPGELEGLSIPFSAVAADVLTGAEVVMSAGDVTEAIRASMAVPGFLTPVRRGGRILVDGGLVNPVPVSIARAMGADVVIAVDLNHDVIDHRLRRVHKSTAARTTGPGGGRLLEALRGSTHPAAAQLLAWLERQPLPGLFDVLISSLYIMQAQVSKASLASNPPDLLICPDVGAIQFLEFDRGQEIMEAGYRAAKEALGIWPQAYAQSTG